MKVTGSTSASCAFLSACRCEAELLGRRDSHDIPVDDLLQTLVPEDHVERLVPRHLIEAHREVPLDLGVDHDVQPDEVGEEEKDVLEVGLDEVHRDLLAGIRLLVPDDRQRFELGRHRGSQRVARRGRGLVEEDVVILLGRPHLLEAERRLAEWLLRDTGRRTRSGLVRGSGRHDVRHIRSG